MTPPCRTFSSATLESEIQTYDTGKKRKLERGQKNIDLSQCALMGMLQYECRIDQPEKRDSPVRCWPVRRWFRRCQDKKGSFLVETTDWEKPRQSDEAAA
ncbi:hypothetical protein PG994_005609 [Apiospora phragmitis]|uniref:Uncharacterized protein n=1 Tax=Apiospora phragmitis TaxID=2905665 RepID=A0ABR1VCT4_9PEZI